MADWKEAFKQDTQTAPTGGTWQDLFKNKAQPVKQEILPEAPSLPPIFEASKAFPAAPKWYNVIEPIQQKQEVADNIGEFIIGTAGKFDKALAGMFNQLDYVQTTLGDALNQILVGREAAAGIQKMRNEYGVHLDEVGGKPNINSIRPFKAISDAINWAASGSKELPNTVGGQIAGGIASMGPEILAATVAPEIKMAKFMSDLGIKVASKFGTVMGIEGFINGMSSAEQGNVKQQLTTPIISGIEQYMTGWMYDNMGAMASKLGGKLALKFIPEVKTVAQANNRMLIGSLGTTTSNALMFGGYGTASEFLETGKSSWKTFNTGFGMGIALGGREVAKGLWAKGMNTFAAADISTIKRAAESDLSSEELNIHTQEKTKAVENNTSKNPEGDIAAAIISTNTSTLKAVVEEIKSNPQDVIKSIEESTIDPKMKEILTDKVYQVIAETDPAAVEAKTTTDKITALDAQIEILEKNTHLSPTDKEIQIKSLAAKRDGMVTKVVSIYDKHKTRTPEEQRVIEEKTAEDTKQARIAEVKAVNMMPEFTARGEALAAEFGGRFEARLKPVESIVNKTTREVKEVSDVNDIIGGAIIVSDLGNFKDVSKRLKQEGYTISNKRKPGVSGERGVTAIKNENGIGTEIQIHTEKTWEAQKEANKIRDKYRKEGVPPMIESIDPGEKVVTANFPENYIPEIKIRKSGNDRIEVKDSETGEVVSSFAMKTKEYDGDTYWSGGSLQTHQDYQNKGLGQNVLRLAMDNLPDGVRGLYFPKETIKNEQQVPHLFEKLGKEFNVLTKENGDVVITPKEWEAQINSHKEFGGSTFSQSGENLAGAKGRASVSVFPDRTVVIKGDPTPGDLSKFKETNQDILKDNEKLSVGTWKNEKGETELDIVVVTSKAKAIELGKKYNQKAIFDLEKMEEVSTGGTGGGEEFKKVPIADRVTEATATPYDDYLAAMEQSRKLYDEAYLGLENISLEGSPAKTPLERKMKTMQIPIATQKELNKSWTETKKLLLTGVKDANRDMKAEFKAFVKEMPLTGLGVPLRKAMLNKVNSIDFTKPKSLENAIKYFDKIIDNATFRLHELEFFKGLTTLDHKTSDLDVKVNGILKAKAGPDYLPTREHLEGIRKNMLEADYNKAQEEIQAIYDKYKTENGDAISLEDLQRIEDLSFHGLLNQTNQATLPELKGAVNSLKSIIKLGKAEAAARRMIRRAQEKEYIQDVFNIIDGKPGKPVVLESKLAANLKPTAYQRIARAFDWAQLDSWFTFLDKLSKFDKGSDPYQSILNKELGGAVLQADQATFSETHTLYNQIQNKAKDIFGTKSNSQLRRASKERTKTLHTIFYNEMGVFDKRMDITENQAYKKYMEFQDPSLVKANEAGGYMKDGQLTDLGQKVQDVMSPATKAWADWQLNEFYPMMYDIINPKYKELYGRDMPMGENYSPIFVDGKGKDIAENDILAQQHLLNTATNASLKTRVAHANELRLMDGDKVLLNYVDKMIYFKNWSDALSLLNNTFVKDQNIKTAIQQNFGDIYNKVATNFIDEFARQPKNLNTYIKAFEKIRNNFAISSLAIKPTVFFAQLTAIPAYLEKVPTLKYANEFRKFITNPKESWDILQELRKDAFWQQRYGEGWDRDVIAAMREDLHSLGGNAWQNWKNQTMFLTKYGDMAAVVMGGLPMYRHVYSEAIKRMGPGAERQAKAEAMAAFAQATRDSQQAGQSYDLSVMQRANSFTKLLTMYKTSPFQYHRKVTGAVRNITRGRGDVSDNLKTIAIYHIILPQIFQIVGNGFRWDKEDQLRALGFGNINEIFVAGDIMKGITNTWQGLPFDYQMTPVESTWKSAQKGAAHIKKANIQAIFDAAEEVNMDEVYKAITDLGNTVGDVTGTPVHGVTAIAKGIKDVATGNTNFPVQRILGYSEKAVEGGQGFFDSSESEDKVTKYMNDIKNPTLKKILDMNNLPAVTKKSLPGKSNKVMPSIKKKNLPKQ